MKVLRDWPWIGQAGTSTTSTHAKVIKKIKTGPKLRRNYKNDYYYILDEIADYTDTVDIQL